MTTPPDDLTTLVQQLTEAMAKATPGPWHTTPCSHGGALLRRGDDSVLRELRHPQPSLQIVPEADAAYIALCSPSNMACLLVALTDAQARADNLPSVEHCRCERAEGNGGCGACALCCKEQRERAQAAEARATQAEARLADYQAAVSQRDEIIAELTARCDRYQEASAAQRERATQAEQRAERTQLVLDLERQARQAREDELKAEVERLTRELADCRSEAIEAQDKCIEGLTRELAEAQKQLAIASLATPLTDDLHDAIDAVLKDVALQRWEGLLACRVPRLLEQCQQRMADDWLRVGRAERERKSAEAERDAAVAALRSAVAWLRGEPVIVEEESGPRVVALTETERIDAYLWRALGTRED